MKRRIIVCCDGTWNQPDQMQNGQLHPTNVVKLARSLLPEGPDGTTQIVYYHTGVGTGWDPLDQALGGGFGRGLSENIKDAYRFIVNNYLPDDELYLFGFSRGAYTVRSLAGFIRKCGILNKSADYLLPDAYELYRSTDDKPDGTRATDFRGDHSRESRIKFIGVWDTVGALGIPENIVQRLAGIGSSSEFHDVALSRSVDFAYQALAIDEQRTPFKPTVWEQNPDHGNQVLEQVWFAGVHTDVGGGSPTTGLSDFPFLWMRAKAADTGLAFDDDYITSIVKPDTMGPAQNTLKGFYHAWQSYSRPIGEGPQDNRLYQDYTSNEWVADTAIKRLDMQDPPYEPPNLLHYIEIDPQPSVTDVPRA